MTTLPSQTENPEVPDNTKFPFYCGSAPAFHAAVLLLQAGLRNNVCSMEQVPELLASFHKAALKALGTELAHSGQAKAEAGAPKAPAHETERESSGACAHVKAENTIFDDYLICLEDGARVRMLTRYIQSRFGLTPAQYRLKWNLPHDYPMVAPSLKALRSQIAREVQPHKARYKSGHE